MALAPDVPYDIGDAAYGGYVAGIIDTTQGNIIPEDASQQGLRYVLIFAPESMQEYTGLTWKDAQTAAPGATRTRWDGLSATQAMLADSGTYPAAEYCASFSAPDDGGSPWYLPAMDELELAYRNWKPTREDNKIDPPRPTQFPPVEVLPGVNPSSDPSGSAYTTDSPRRTSITRFREGQSEYFGDAAGRHGPYLSATEASTNDAWQQYFTGPNAGFQTPVIKTSTGIRFVRPVRRVVLNKPPHAPTLIAPVDQTISTTQANRFTVGFNDPDAGDSLSALRIWARPEGAAEWAVDTGWITTPTPAHGFPAGTFTEGDWEWQAATKDTQGVEGPRSPSAFFTADVPPPGPTITAPANGATVPLSTETVVWSTPDQDAYQIQFLDEDGAVAYDTGQVDSVTARSRTLDFPDNQVTRTIRLRVLFEGLWSPWSTITVHVSYTQPPVPVVTVDDMTTPGAIRVQASHPDPADDQPAVEYIDIYRRETQDTGPGIRRATMLLPTATFADWFVASGVDYAYRVCAFGTNGTSSWSDWTEEPEPIWEDLDGGTPSSGGGTNIFDGGTP